jgi:hypothetical protein
MRPDLNIIYKKSLFSVFKKPSLSIKMLQLSKKKLLKQHKKLSLP